MAKLGKRTRAAREAFAGKEELSVEEAIALIKSSAGTKFDETVEIAMNLGVDPRHADQMVRGVVGLPNGTGKTVRVAVFAKDAKADEARAAGAEHVGAEDLYEKINGGFMEFDRVIASPDMMKHVGKLGRVLGPSGKMPSPKSGTVTADVAGAVEEFKAGKVEFRTDAGGNVHAPVGRASFSTEDLVENLTTFVDHVTGMRPATVKGTFVRRICVSTSMGPGLWISHGS